MKNIKQILTKKGHNPYFHQLTSLSRQNRNRLTPAEALVWNTLLKNRQSGFRFLRQKPITQFILDFYSPKLLLAIEIDGEYHQDVQKHDHNRDLMLSSLGIKTIRFSNDQVLNNLNQVAIEIKSAIDLRCQEIKIKNCPFEGKCPAGTKGFIC